MHDDITTVSGYASTVYGLAPNVTYSVSFSSFGSGANACTYGGATAGSFLTD